MPTVKELRDFCRMAGIPCSGVKAALTTTVTEYLHRFKYPQKYMTGLDPDEAWEKKFALKASELKERNGGSPNFRELSSDARHSTKPSTYTTHWLSLYPHATTLEAQSKVSGVPTDILDRVYSKGLAAWRGGHHRPGASQHAWAMARVYSFLTKGKTFFTADGRLAEEAAGRSGKAQRFWNGMA
jgi:hypothetical protein